jgi:hypothetical protein
MEHEYRVEIDLSLDEQSELSVIKLARKVYVRRGVATYPRGGERAIPPARFIPGLEHALIELAEANSMFDEAGIRIIRTACGCRNAQSGGQGHWKSKFAGCPIFLR